MTTQQHQGRLLYLMGPSGSGKDSLLHHARELAQENTHKFPLHIAQRHITRQVSASAHDEQHISLSQEEFLQALEAGDFVMHWQSHGLYYGIHKNINTLLNECSVVIVNGSRAYLAEAQQKYPHLIPVLITVDSSALRARLEARGRESAEDIEKRIERAHMDISALKNMPNVHRIDNSGELCAACTAFGELLSTMQNAYYKNEG